MNVRRAEHEPTRSAPRACSRRSRGQLVLWRGATPWPRLLVASEQVLRRAVAPARLAATLDSLVGLGVLKGYEIKDGLVYLEGDRTALQMAVAEMDAVEGSVLGDDVAHGFQESSGVYGEVTRGGSTARAADFYAVRTYYSEARAFLARDRTMTKRARRIWEMHSEGAGERAIAAKLGIAGRQVRKHLEALRKKAGLSRRKGT